MQVEVPAGFEGIPIMSPMMSRFFGWEADRKTDDIPALWAFAEAIVRREPESIEPRLFNRCLEGACVSVTNLTMSMYWMRPNTYLALDSRNRKLLDERGMGHKVDD
jgi:5-methylcytosine-specific restriction enzyme B